MKVIVCKEDIRKMIMTSRLNTVEDLIGWLKGSVEADYTFTLQYQDPEFNKVPTIQFIPVLELVPAPTCEVRRSACSHADTEILSASSVERCK